MELLLMDYNWVILNYRIMETDFSKTITCNDGQVREFHFARINSVAIYFHISVFDKSSALITGTLARDENGQWKLRETELPNWFKHAEPELSEAVEVKEVGE
jgi:hypothetical protein